MVTAHTRAALSRLEVVPMRRWHLRQVVGIEQRVYPRPWSPAVFSSEMSARDTRRYVVALCPRDDTLAPLKPGRKVVGYAGVLVQVDEAHVTTVAVHPHHHRQKVATHLLVALMGEARRLGARAATLEVRVGNRGAQRLYRAFGFAPVGVRPRYYAETGEDALIMWVHDIHGSAYDDVLAVQRERLTQPGGASGAPDYHVPWVQGRRGLAAAVACDPPAARGARQPETGRG